MRLATAKDISMSLWLLTTITKQWFGLDLVIVPKREVSSLNCYLRSNAQLSKQYQVMVQSGLMYALINTYLMQPAVLMVFMLLRGEWKLWIMFVRSFGIA